MMAASMPETIRAAAAAPQIDDDDWQLSEVRGTMAELEQMLQQQKQLDEKFADVFESIGSIPTGERRAIVWFRNDLRLHDTPVLLAATAPTESGGAAATQVLCVYIFDPRQFKRTVWGSPKTAAFRATFLVEAVTELRRRLEAVGSRLLVAVGAPEVLLPQLNEALDAQRPNPTWELTTVLWAEQLTSEESAVSFAVKAAMQQGVRFRAIRSGSLYPREALPFAADLADLPNVFTPFRKAVEGSTAPPWEEGFVKGGISRGDGAQLVRNSHEIGPGLPFRAA